MAPFVVGADGIGAPGGIREIGPAGGAHAVVDDDVAYHAHTGSVQGFYGYHEELWLQHRRSNHKRLFFG